MKTGFLTVSFGTTHLDPLEKTIAATENDLKAAFPEAGHYRAFTSGIVRSRLKSKYGIQVDSVEEALARIRADGVQQVVVQPTLLIPGEEYDKQRAKVLQNAGTLKVAMSLPLLWDDTDLDTMIGLLGQNYPVAEDTVLVAMGHGTEHPANSLYVRLAERMADKGMLLCTVEGKPDFEDALEALRGQPKRRAHLVPLLLVAGDHAKNDMAGDGPDSLRGMLEQAGIKVEWTLQGLGELPAVRKLYVRRAAVAYHTLQKRSEA